MKKNTQIILIILFSGFYLFLNQAAAQEKPYEQIGNMILQNQQSAVNPLYNVPCGSVNPACYLTMAFASGWSVTQPLSYFVSEAPASYYINYSLRPFVSERGKNMNIVLSANKISATTTEAYAYVFADWNRNGIFEANLGKYTITGLKSEGVSGVSISVDIPENASIGKNRLRVYLTNKVLATVNPTDQISGGYIYDFVFFVNENSGNNTNVPVFVSSNNVDWGSAIVQTASPASDNRYAPGTNVTLRAVKAPLSSFEGWSNGTQIVSTGEEYTFSVSEPVYLVAVFSKLMSRLEAPQTSTADKPVWYQIKNAQTDSRLNRFIAYDPAIPAGYITQLRIEKPEDFSDRFLWRLQPSANNQVKIVNKGSNKQIIADGTLNVSISVADTGSDFQVVSSGAANGSYSVKWNSINDRLLNGGLSFNIVLYNAGVGTGSGWYFYRVPDEVTAVETVKSAVSDIFLSDGLLIARNLMPQSELSVYNLLGHAVYTTIVAGTEISHPFDAKGVFVAVVRTPDAKYSTVKIMQ